MSIIGSSSIFGIGKGPTGPTGNFGPTGNTGNSGITKGTTGATGVYVSIVQSDRSRNRITFYTSDGNRYVLDNFSGPTAYVYGSDGVSAAFGPNYYSLFAGVSSGYTFNFLGLCAGTNISITQSPDKNRLLLSLVASSGSYTTNPSQDYVAFIDGSNINPTKIYSDTNNILNFGLTGIPSGITFNKVFINLAEEITVVNSQIVNPIGGITLDLTQSSNYWIETPIGITAFSSIPLPGIRQEYTLFFNGSDVWNLPKNLYFENSELGIQNYAFLDGINILHIWSDNAGVTFNASFIERGVGSVGPYSSFNIGSCCYTRYGYNYCYDNVNKATCDGLGGNFQAMTNCFSRTSNDGCASFSQQNIRGETGACCCGITGCIDENVVDPIIVRINKDICQNVIGGKFYPKQTCRTGDQWKQYSTRPMNGNTADNIMCHKSCIEPVSCCRIVSGNQVCTQETKWYCEQVLGGSAIINKTCAEVDALGGCAELTRTGHCIKFGVCSELDNIPKYECIECGAWVGQNCNATITHPEAKVIITTLSPFIKIVHSVKQVDDYNIVTTYTDRDPTKRSLSFQISEETTQKHTLYGIVKFLDVTNTYGITVYDIWDLNENTDSCFKVKVKDEDGIQLTEDSFLYKNTNYFLELTAKPSECLDTDFKAELYLGLNSCIGGFTLGSKSENVPIVYTRSPCSCIAIGTGIKKGDVINKAPITIPFTAERYCTDCTKKYVGIAGDYKNIVHLPYVLKKQTGIITFCPPTENFIDNPISVCTNPEGFCISYNPIEEINGCTYSSLFDANGDGLIGKNDQNTLPDGCFHAEYNESGTTYFYTGLPNQNIRTCTSNCQKRIHYSGSSDELSNINDCSNQECLDPADFGYSSDCCVPTIQRKSTWLGCATCPGNVVPVNTTCTNILKNPYFNKIHLDTNALYDIGQRYNIDTQALEKNIIGIIEKKSYLFNPNYTFPLLDKNVGGATIEQTVVLAGQPTITVNPDPDDRAKTSCATCSDFFDRTKKIQIPTANFDSYQYDVYGLVLTKQNICDVEEKGTTTPKTYTEINIDNKYYIFIQRSDGCHLVYDIANQTIVKNNILNSLPKFYNSVSSCSLNCEDYTVNVKEIKWFGKVTNTSPGTCTDTYSIQYNLLKNINEVVDSFTPYSTYSIQDLIAFTGLSYNSSLEDQKKTTLAKKLLEITTGIIDTYNQNVCLLCQNDDCFSDIIENLVEFIGKGCSLTGISGTVNDAEIYDKSVYFLPDEYNVPYNPSIKYKDVSAGFYYTLGITDSDGITGWGRNRYGEMSGFGNSYKKISAGPNSICAIDTSNNLICKSNESGIIPSNTTAKEVSCGYGHTVWIDMNNNVKDISGGGYYSSSPSGLTASKISSGKFHSCAVKGNGTVVCWGDNEFTQTTVPTGVVASKVVCGGHHTLALKTDGSLTAWGTTFSGVGTIPLNLQTARFKDIAAGYIHNCGIKLDGTIVCWGYTLDGQCNSPTTGNYVKISAGREHTVAIDSDGGITCWGATDEGICGSFIERTKVAHERPNVYWFKEGIERTNFELPAGEISQTQTGPYYLSKVYNELDELGVNYNEYFRQRSLDNKIFSDAFIGVIYSQNNKILSEKQYLKHPNQIFKFYYPYNPKTNTINTYELSYMFYDRIYQYSGNYFRNNENKYVILRRNLPKISPQPFASDFKISDVKTYVQIITDTDNGNPGGTYSYQSYITFNVKSLINSNTFVGSVYDVGFINYNQYYNSGNYEGEYIKPISNIVFEDGNSWSIAGPETTDPQHPSLNFKDKYLILFDGKNVKPGPYYTSLKQYPGISADFGVFVDEIFTDMDAYSKTGYFDIKPLPSAETGSIAVITKKNINGNCVEIDCTDIPDICSALPNC